MKYGEDKIIKEISQQSTLTVDLSRTPGRVRL